MSEQAFERLKRLRRGDPDAERHYDGAVQLADGSRLIALPADPILRLAALRAPLGRFVREGLGALNDERDTLEGEARTKLCRELDELLDAYGDIENAIWRVALTPRRLPGGGRAVVLDEALREETGAAIADLRQDAAALAPHERGPLESEARRLCEAIANPPSA